MLLIPKEYWVQLDYTNIELIVQFLIRNNDFRFLIPGSNDLAYISVCKVIQRIMKGFFSVTTVCKIATTTAIATILFIFLVQIIC